MRKQIILKFIGVAILFCSCSKGGNTNQGNSRQIRYEITGNYSGKLSISYWEKNSSTLTLFTNVQIPWNKDVQYAQTVEGSAITAETDSAGSLGQTAVLKIYSNNNLIKSTTASTNNVGYIVLPAIEYNFP